MSVLDTQHPSWARASTTTMGLFQLLGLAFYSLKFLRFEAREHYRLVNVESLFYSSAPAPSKKLFIDNSRNRFFFLRNKTRLSAKVRLPVFPKFLRKFSKDRKNDSRSRDGKIFGRKNFFLVLLRKKNWVHFSNFSSFRHPKHQKVIFRNVRLVCFRFCSSNDNKQQQFFRPFLYQRHRLRRSGQVHELRNAQRWK